jgi:hypothetical protein
VDPRVLTEGGDHLSVNLGDLIVVGFCEGLMGL